MQWKAVEIVSTRLCVRPFAPADAGEAFACMTPTLTRYMSFDPPPSEAAFAEVWRNWLEEIDAGRDFTFTVRDLTTHAFVGLCGLHRTFEPMPELGIWVRESQHGRGYGREAVTAVASWGSAAFQPNAFVYPVAVANLASRRIAESLGGVAHARHSKPKYDRIVYQIPVPLRSVQ